MSVARLRRGAIQEHRPRSRSDARRLRGAQGRTNDALTALDEANSTEGHNIGCSAGSFLRLLRDRNEARAPDASYVGVEIEERFSPHWNDPEIEYVVSDIRNYSMPEGCSFITSLFSLQFISERERGGVLERIHKSLAPEER